MKPPINFFSSVFPFSFSLFLLLGCAHRGAPGGGPEDKSTPAVVTAMPSPDSLHAPVDRAILLTMSEWMEPQSVERALFVSPALPPMNIKTAGKKIRIIPQKPLLDSTTYVVTLGTDAKDLRGNALDRAYTLSFSTGGRIDTAGLSGTLRDDRGNPAAQGLSLFAYLKNDSAPPDPVRDPAAYITQGGTDGSFRFRGLKFGAYRVFAVGDLNRNRKFDPGREKIAIPAFDIILSPEGKPQASLHLRSGDWDTSGLGLKKISSQPGGRLLVQFSKPPAESLFLNPACYAVSPAETPGDTPRVTQVFPLAATDPWVLLVLSNPLPKLKYRLELRNLPAGDGAPPDTARRQLLFLGNPLADTLAPALASFVPRRGDKNAAPGDTMRFYFSEPVREEMLKQGYTLSRLEMVDDTADTLHRFDTLRHPVAGNGRFPSPMEFQFLPDTLISGASYEWRMDPRQLADPFGNFSPDTTLHGIFSAVGAENFGTLSGTVSGADAARVRLILRARAGEKRFELSPKKNGYYAVPNVPEGAYRFFGYLDENNNGKWDRGAVRPFRFSERLFTVSDSLYIRAKWDVEDFSVKIDSLPEGIR